MPDRWDYVEAADGLLVFYDSKGCVLSIGLVLYDNEGRSFVVCPFTVTSEHNKENVLAA